MNINPWHTLIVTGKHYHNDPDCPGHTHPDDDTCDDEIEHELQHPDDCPAKTDKTEYRCHAEYEVMECYGDNEFPMIPGTYRVRVSTSYDGWTGEYDLDIDVEDVDVPPAPTEPAPCKREPWPEVQTFTPPPLSAVKLEIIPTEAGNAA